jgi:hypothetical protein
MSMTSTTRTESDLAVFGRTCAAGVVGGGVAGAVVVGVLSRLVMRILGAANPHVRGQLTDDGEEVGFVTLEGTLSLLSFGVAVGAIAGLVYLWVTRILPESPRSRTLLFALLCGAIGGALFVHDYSSFDYSQLEPRWFSVVSFVALPTMFGLAAPPLIEWFRGPTSVLRRVPVAALAVVAFGILLILPPAALLTGAAVGVAALIRFVPALYGVWTSRAVTVVGVGIFVVLVVVGLSTFVTHVASVAAQDTPDCSILCLP